MVNNSPEILLISPTFITDHLQVLSPSLISVAASTVGIQSDKAESKKKKEKRVFNVLLTHKNHNKIQKKKKNSQSNLSYSVHPVKREVGRAARILKNMPHIKEGTRKIALRRLHRLHASTYINKPAKKDEKK